MSSVIQYRPEIDGLRSLSVILVIIYHSHNALLPNGYLAVEVFFVISGYLITSIIMQEMAAGDFSLVRFWGRRVKRILPLICTVLLVVSVVQSLLLFRPDLQVLSHQKFSVLLSYANIYFWQSPGDYWSNSAHEAPFLHFWTLSVEEQYYLFYPLIVLFIFTRMRTQLEKLIWVFVGISFALFILGAIYSPNATFYLLPTRAWQIGAGCLLALSPKLRLLSRYPFGASLGLFLIGLMVLFPSHTSGVGYEALVVVIGSCLIIASKGDAFSSALLKNKLAVFIGRISYSLYLWHWPILVTLRDLQQHGMISSKLSFGLIGLSALLVLSLLSFYLIEKPFRRMKFGSQVALVFAVLVGCYIAFVEPKLLSKLYPSNDQAPTWYGLYYDLDPRRLDQFTITSGIQTPLQPASATGYREGGIINLRAEPDPRVVLLGDSHAVMWAHVVNQITLALDKSVALWSINGEHASMTFPPVAKKGFILKADERLAYDTQRQRLIKQWQPELVIMASRWEKLADDDIVKTLDFLSLHAKHVLLIESPPYLHSVANRSFYQYRAYQGIRAPYQSAERGIWQDFSLTDTQIRRVKLLRYIQGRANVYLLPIADLYTLKQGVIVGARQQVYYVDDDHITEQGAQVAASRFDLAISNILKGDVDVFPVVGHAGIETEQTLKTVALPSL